jgi:Xaa-Pro aminopeptidase
VNALDSKYVDRLVSAEAACVQWASVLIEDELTFYPHIVRATKRIIADCYSPATLTPGITTTDDLHWAFMQYSRDRGLDLSFIPFFSIRRSDAEKARYSTDDRVIRPGDLLHCDVGNKYLRLCSDLQEWAYVRRDGEREAPAGMQALFTQVGRLQQIYMDSFEAGLTGDELLKRILDRARAEGVPNPKVYSHGLGYFLHEPGPLIGLPWEQTSNPGRGNVRLAPNTVFTMELSIEDAVPEWGGQMVRLGVEHDVRYTSEGCLPFDKVQNTFYLI